MKQNVPRQTYLHISAPTNLQSASLWQEILTSIKQHGKTEIKNIIKNTCATLLRYEILKAQWREMWTSVYFAISKFILLFSYSFHVPCVIPSNVYFYNVCSMFPFLFNRSQLKASVVNQLTHIFLKLKIFFRSFQLFVNGDIHNIVSTLINIMKLNVGNNNIVSTLSNVANIIFEIDNVDSALWKDYQIENINI